MRAEAVVQPSPPPPVNAVRSEEARFFELDILRGLAAILVVVFHYKHFLLSDTEVFDYDHLPLGGQQTPVYFYCQYLLELLIAKNG